MATITETTTSNNDLLPVSNSAWNDNAGFWDAVLGHDGDQFWQALQEPCLSRLLGDRLASHRQQAKPCRALDLSTGNGLCARWLAARGALVTATDVSVAFLDQARERCAGDGSITFGKLDVTDEADFQPFIEQATENGGFDIILINMAMQDLGTLDPLAKCLPKLLKKDGMFVSQMLHPVFRTSGHSKSLELSFDPATGSRVVTRGKLIKEYMHVGPCKMQFDAEKQSTPHIMFHRPLHELFGIFFKHGLVMDALEEPSFTEEHADPKRLELTKNFTQLPAAIAFRLRRADNSSG